jgi:hypothetical protein
MQALDTTAKAVFAAGGLLVLLAGAGWAYFGTEIFLSVIMAGLAYCF